MDEGRSSDKSEILSTILRLRSGQESEIRQGIPCGTNSKCECSNDQNRDRGGRGFRIAYLAEKRLLQGKGPGSQSEESQRIAGFFHFNRWLALVVLVVWFAHLPRRRQHNRGTYEIGYNYGRYYSTNHRSANVAKSSRPTAPSLLISLRAHQSGGWQFECNHARQNTRRSAKLTIKSPLKSPTR